MTGPELFERFNVLYNNIMSNAAPGLDAYDVSVYLTKAYKELVKNYFSKRGNKYQEGFDDSAKRQTDFIRLIVNKSLSPVTLSIPDHIDRRGLVYEVPSDILYVLNEFASFTLSGKNHTKVIVPIKYDEYTRLMSKPFGGPKRKQAWRLEFSDSGNLYYELILNESPSQAGVIYNLRYVKIPKPIIVANLLDLGSNLTIDGISQETGCDMNDSTCEEIIQRAVELAKAAYSSDQSGQVQMQNQITVGQRSE